MDTVLDPIVSEFDNQSQAEAYDMWFREQVQQGIDSPVRLSHDEALAWLAERRKQRFAQFQAA